MPEVVVVGSTNADLVVEVPRRPSGGETLLGSNLALHPGGKGANQAAASARAGAATRLVGCLGDDDHGAFLRRGLQDAGVDVEHVHTVERPTGTAIILVTPDGENSIVVSPGANSAVDVELVERPDAGWTEARVVVLSMEIPAATVDHVATAAAARGIRVVLNAAPARELPADTLRACDPLIVNEHEARIVLGRDASGFEELARGLLDAGARSVVITLGVDGALVADPDGLHREAGRVVEVVDTTGAGDAFVGAVACELSHGAPLRDAVRFAVAMSAITVGARGAQSSYPDRPVVESLLAGR
ncbi:ribokinase [Micromonospora sp. NPDC047740]|uniref:ribokinase n=1 Tax=Micromonospora sp. NPDC047740 TaxID=3364254 RepID=UPI00371BB8D1